jgi:hypothetical protein
MDDLTTAQYLMSKEGAKARNKAAADFDARARTIALETLEQQRVSLATQRGAQYKGDLALIDATIESVKKGLGKAAVTLLDDKSVGDQDDVAAR